MKDKNYIFIFPSICNIGGAQLYLVNKMKYLEANGWKVNVLYARKDVILINQLRRFENNAIEAMQYSTSYYRRNDIIKAVDQACLMIQSELVSGKIIIESSTVSNASWAELIAKKLNCKHVCFDFEEVFSYLSESQLDFMKFKLDRGELAGITLKSIPLMLKKKVELPESYSYWYNAIPAYAIDYEAEYQVEGDDADVTIGSFGRLDKEFVYPALIEIKEYIMEHPDKKYKVLLIGGSKDKKYIKKIKDLFENVATLEITGEIFPVPIGLISSVDVFVSSSGSATATAREGIPTISMSAKSLKANGILDYTTAASLFNENGDSFNVKDLLVDVLDRDYCNNHEKIGMFTNWKEEFEIKCNREFERQVNLVLSGSSTNEYYNVFEIQRDGKRKLISIYSKIVGMKLFHVTIKIANKFFGTLVKG